MRRVLALAIVIGSALASSADAAPQRLAWVGQSASPVGAAGALTDFESAMLARCGAGEAGLFEVARAIVERKLRGDPSLDLDGVTLAQRAAGEPHVWPRAWALSGRAIDRDAALARLAAWRASFRDRRHVRGSAAAWSPPEGEERCGVASGVSADGRAAIAVVAVDALADLAPLPLRARVGQWLAVDARLLVPAAGAKVIVLGPSGSPRAVPTSVERGRVRARFTPDRPGDFTVQVVADVATGPRPVLEASVFADVEPPAEPPDRTAPGEDAGGGASDDAEKLARMLSALRASEGLAPIARDPRLDALALSHARRMAAARTLGHDAGDGNPGERLRDAGLAAREVGENVAHASTIARAHRALFASPSHRANLLRDDWTALGVATIEDADGSAWVVELFATRLR